MIKKCFSFLIAAVLTLSCGMSSVAINFGYEDVLNIADMPKPDLALGVPSAVLMEATTGIILYSEGLDISLPPASVTKIMTLLLIMEALEAGRITLNDDVTISEHAASMGGTQVYLEIGEVMKVNDLIKSIAVPSANDATVAMAEYVAGSEEEFVRQMNERAEQLGALKTHFNNATGLFDDPEHVTTAQDLALMTKELLKHPKIFDYTTIWMDTLRDGAFGLANTNKMLKTYSGMNGMKTGFTKLSGYCFSGTAQRDGMTLIATIMGAKTSSDRFSATAKMLDYGFATFSVATASPEAQQPIPVLKGKKNSVNVEVEGGLSILVKKGQSKQITTQVSVAEKLNAPIEKGTEIGTLSYLINNEIVGSNPILTSEKIEKAIFGDYFMWLFNKILL